MKRIILFFIIYFCELVVFSQPTGVNGKWEFAGDINIPSGKNFLIGNVPIGGSNITAYALLSINEGATATIPFSHVPTRWAPANTTTGVSYGITVTSTDSLKFKVNDGYAGTYFILLSVTASSNVATGGEISICFGYTYLVIENATLKVSIPGDGYYHTFTTATIMTLFSGDVITLWQVGSGQPATARDIKLVMFRIGN